MIEPSDFDDLLGRIRGLIIDLTLAGVFSAEEAGEVEKLLEHAELGEALTTLAWIVVEEDKQISRADLTEIQSLARRMAIEDELPEGLPEHMTDLA